jgi:hypothetical protein
MQSCKLFYLHTAGTSFILFLHYLVNMILTTLQAKKVTRRSPAMRPWSKVNFDVKFVVICFCNYRRKLVQIFMPIEAVFYTERKIKKDLLYPYCPSLAKLSQVMLPCSSNK